jgi:hypothetical protein
MEFAMFAILQRYALRVFASALPITLLAVTASDMSIMKVVDKASTPLF